MANLHSALKSLSPVKFSEVPQDTGELDPYLADLFIDVQSVVESIPIPDPDPSLQSRHGYATTSEATNAAEMSVSSARSPPPAPEYAVLQKEWGKPIKLSAKENPTNIAVYKLGGKDGKGAWFARRSVHEGLGFTRFKRGFEREFPTSLAVQGAPGEGNIRGIGAETKVEEITVPNRGKVEVYRLSAQFPGPTTPRDFVTLLITSSKAIKPHGDAHKTPDLAPRHYMIVSKPCDHPDTQPRSGFIRGQYESVEFIREIPRKLKSTTSTTDLTRHAHNRPVSPSLEKEVLKHNAEKREISFDKAAQNEHRDNKHLSVNTSNSAHRELSPASRKRSATVGIPASPIMTGDPSDHYDPEDNPVEWIMVTRSDPGGSVPRFMVERGTPASICADALKFLDWACQSDDDEKTPERRGSRPTANRRESFASWEANGTLAGIREHEVDLSSAVVDRSSPPTPKGKSQGAEPFPSVPNAGEREKSDSVLHSPSSPSQMLAAVSDTLNAYTPQVVRDYLPHLQNLTPKASPRLASSQVIGEDEVLHLNVEQPANIVDNDDASSTISSTSFASADSHITSDESPSISSKSLVEQTSESQTMSQHDKELLKLSERKAAMDSKFAQQREKITSQATKETEKEQQALKKAEEKHERELKKHEEKYQKEVARLEAKKNKEAKKLIEKKRKQEEKDEKVRLTRERDEARAQLELLKKENDIFQRQIGELQKENTAITARLGKLEGGGVESPASGTTRFRALTTGQDGRNRSSSILSRKKNNKSDDASSEAS